jgi:pimeloyl-ACP methyl ester carboxylesterase
MPRPLIAALAVLLASACASARNDPAPAASQAVITPPPVLSVEPYTFIGRGGVKVEAERGQFAVPENRNDPNSRKITLTFVRFPSTSATPGEPIVYLAGGPGGSGIGTARGARFPIFMKLREVADVIAFDQRGTGLSNDLPVCRPQAVLSPEQPLTHASITDYYRTEIAACFDWWKSQGMDIDGYTTLESAHDLDDLRRALGVEKINLWGISYGSHLGLAMMKAHPKSVRRAVLASIEGLDETVKLPAETDAYFARVQAAIDQEPKAKAAYPDLAGLMRRVHAKLDATPAQATFTPPGASQPATITFDSFPIQLLASGMTADPGSVARLPLFYLALDKGEYGQAAQTLYREFFDRPPSFSGMPEAMDLASGMTARRKAITETQAKTALLGDALNFPMPQIAGIRPQIDLGDGFRAPFRSDVPTLFISATLDGRTYPAEAKATVAGFSAGRRLIVENGGHNIYEADPRVADAVFAWFTGGEPPASIHLDPPKFPTP